MTPRKYKPIFFVQCNADEGFLVLQKSGVYFFRVPYLLWQTTERKELDVLIVGKTTVPNQRYREHKGLTWFLNYFKYNQSGQTNYQINEEYFERDFFKL